MPTSTDGIERAAVVAGARVHRATGLVEAAAVVTAAARPGDVVVTMSVGEVASLATLIKQALDRPVAAVV